MQQDHNNLKNNIKKQGVDYDVLSKNYDNYKKFGLNYFMVAKLLIQ